METKITVQVDFYATAKSVFGTGSMRVNFSPPATIKKLLNTICQTSRQKTKIFHSSGRIQKDILVLRNGRNIIFLNGSDTELQHEDIIAIFPPVAGG